MELIKDLGTRLINGKWISFGEFLCIFCLQKIEKRLYDGLKQKSCGCAHFKLISIANSGENHPMYGKKQTEDTKQKIRLANTGKKRTEEQRKNISNAHKGLNFGKNNPMYGKKHTEETRKKQREAKLGKYEGENNPLFGKKRTEEQKNKQSEIMLGRYIGNNNPNYGNGDKISGEKHWNWQNGISFEPYPPEFNKELKQQILERDDYICQCPDCIGKSIILQIHHIDYDKKNNNPENLITLCNSCHTKTNGKKKRLFWTEFYQKIMMSKLMECLL